MYVLILVVLGGFRGPHVVTTVGNVKGEIACTTMDHSWVDWMDGKDGDVTGS
jgi:hypothetical protein